jgi:putative solute:sodium symporter small subunit
MSDNDTQPTDDQSTRPDGGTVTGRRQAHDDTDYLTSEVNLLRPSTPFMRDHLRIIWTGFAVWALVVFGPVTLTALAPGAMTTTMPVVGFPLHYFLVAIGAPGGALALAFWYARKRDELDAKYGIEHATGAESGGEDAAAADGGASE